MHEVDQWPDSAFVTLTYADEHLPIDGSLDRDEFTRFWKRLRKRLDACKRKARYYGCGEYGERFGRPHYHAVVFGVSPFEEELVADAWRLGHVRMGSVTFDSARYVAGYLKKTAREGAWPDGKVRPFTVCSHGLGKAFCLQNAEQLRSNLWVSARGIRMGLPRYYRVLLGLNNDSRLEERAFVKRFEERLKVAESLGVSVSDLAVDTALKSIRLRREQEQIAWGDLRRKGVQ